MEERNRTLWIAARDEECVEVLQGLIADMVQVRATCTASISLEATREALHTTAYDLYLVDTTLDADEGRTVLAVADAAACQEPLVLLAETASPEEIVRLLRLGADEVLPWDRLDTASLEQAIRKALARSTAAHRHLPHSLLEHAQDIITVVSMDGTMQYVSPAAERMLGHPPSFYIGRNAFAFIHEEDHDLVFQTLAEVLAEPGTARRVEYRFQHQNGSWRILESVGNAIATDAGALRVVVNSRDVTERRQAVEALRQSEAFTRALLNAMPDAMIRIGRDGTYAGYTAPPGFRWFVEPDAFMGKRPEEVLPPDLARQFLDARTRALETGEVQTVEYGIELDNATHFREARLIAHADGEVIQILRDFTAWKQTELQLRASESKFRDLFANSPDAIVVTSLQGDVLDVNHSACELHGRPRDALLSHNLLDLIAPEQRAAIGQAFGQMTSGNVELVESAALAGDGRSVPVEIRARRIIYDNRPALLLHVRDITERLEAEASLRRSEARNRAIVEALPDALVRLARDGTYLDIHIPKDYAAFTDPDDLLGRSAFEMLPPAVAEHARACVEYALETGTIQTFEYEIAVGDDQRIREGRVVPYGDDEVISIQRDITEQKRAEQEVQRLKAFYEQVLNDIPADIGVMEPNGRILYLNKSSVKDPELRQWLIGKTGVDYCRRRGVNVAIAERRQRYIEQAVAEKSIIRFEEAFSARNGEVRHILRIASPVIGKDGTVRQVIGYGLDITDRKRSEQELKRSREQLRELAQHLQSVREAERTRISREVHDQLGQAMTALRMDITWIERDLTPEQERLLQRIGDMKAIIDETIRTIRRIASDLRPGILDDLGLAAALEWQTQEFATRTGVDFSFTDQSALADLDPNLATAIFRVFQELLTNVARHAHASRVDVTLAADAEALRLVVTDDGRGIANLERVHSKSLGMLGMRERTQAWGGGVRFASTPGQGTTATVEIPLRLDEGVLRG